MTNESRTSCGLEEIPHEFRAELTQLLLHYSVTLIGLWKDGRYFHGGSGTLVQSGSQHFVLTAAHCAQELAKCHEIGLGIVEIFDLPHRFVIPNRPRAIVVPNQREFGVEWGPDLAFLPVPPDKVGDLNARKSFCNLDARQETMLKTAPDTDHRGFWAFVGTSASTSNLEDPGRPQLNLTVHWVFDDIHQQTKSDFDYLDIDVPNLDFRGVSGGGLWRIDLRRYVDGRWTIVDAPRWKAALSTRQSHEVIAVWFAATDEGASINTGSVRYAYDCAKDWKFGFSKCHSIVATQIAF